MNTHQAVKAPRPKENFRPARGDRDRALEVLLEVVEPDSRSSTREIEHKTGTSRMTTWRLLKDEHYKAFHSCPVHALHPGDADRRLNFVAWLATEINRDPALLERILWTDESKFCNNDTPNRHNSIKWATDNPLANFKRGHQRIISINVWCGLIGPHLIGPYFFDGTLNGQRCLDFYQNDLPGLLQDVPLNVRQNMIFQQDGAPAHNARIVTSFLDTTFGNNWIGTRSPVVQWPARSPDLTPLDFYLWGALKDLVFGGCGAPRPAVQSQRELKARIVAGCYKLRNGHLSAVTTGLINRAESCLLANGEQFEHLLK